MKMVHVKFTFTFRKVKIQKSALKIESRILRIKSVGREPEKFLQRKRFPVTSLDLLCICSFLSSGQHHEQAEEAPKEREGARL
jgi:hypothetical protein